jgi:hypothetical protein
LLVALCDHAPKVDRVTGAVDHWRAVTAAQSYREHVDRLIGELAGSPHIDSAAVGEALDAWIRLPDAAVVVDRTPGGAARIARQAAEEFSGFSASAASNASDPLASLRIALLQQIDLAWWADVPDLADAVAVARSAELVDLTAVRARGGVRFGFGVASDRLARRVRDAAVQRLLPRREPRGPGLPFPAARPEVVAVLNDVADTVARQAPAGTPPIWVTSTVRSVEHQRRLRHLGFTALLPSVHCRGWAADVEVSWYERFGAAGLLRDVLIDFQKQGLLNVIDEGRAWHLCLSPSAAEAYGARGIA